MTTNIILFNKCYFNPYIFEGAQKKECKNLNAKFLLNKYDF